MPFDHKTYIARGLTNFKAGKFVNDSTAKVERTTAPTPHWRIIDVHHLTGDENRGGHALYISATNARSEILRPRLEWGWDGQRPNELSTPVALDKPTNEPSGHLVMWPGQIVWARILNEPGDKILGLSTLLGNEDAWNSNGHHSHHVVFLWDDGTVTPEPEPPTEPGDCVELQARVDEAVRLMKQALAVLEG